MPRSFSRAPTASAKLIQICWKNSYPKETEVIEFSLICSFAAKSFFSALILLAIPRVAHIASAEASTPRGEKTEVPTLPGAAPRRCTSAQRKWLFENEEWTVPKRQGKTSQKGKQKHIHWKNMMEIWQHWCHFFSKTLIWQQRLQQIHQCGVPTKICSMSRSMIVTTEVNLSRNHGNPKPANNLQIRFKCNPPHEFLMNHQESPLI